MSYPIAPYAGVPDFICGITRETCEDRGVGAELDESHAADCLVRAATGLASDDRDVEAQTLQTLHQFPGRQLVGGDVIWRGAPDGTVPSSHRLISVMRHEGAGACGPATGRTVRSRIIADCWVVGGQVEEEWPTRDQAAFARCMGIEPRALARDMVAADLDRFVLSYLASFPDARLGIESAIVNEEPGLPVKVALRWGLSGTHAGYGRFGAPTGTPVHVIGLSHAQMRRGRIVQEWIVADEVAVWKQILAHREGKAGADRR